MKEIADLLVKAERSFAAAGRLVDAGDADFAASRAYYGYFYVAQALLIRRGVRPRSHAGSLRQYGLHFEKTGVLEGGFGRWLERAFSARQIADYGSAPQVPPPDEVRELIERAVLPQQTPAYARFRKGTTLLSAFSWVLLNSSTSRPDSSNLLA